MNDASTWVYSTFWIPGLGLHCPRGEVATWIGLDWYDELDTWIRSRLLGCEDDCFATLDTGIRPGRLTWEDNYLGNSNLKSSSMGNPNF